MKSEEKMMKLPDTHFILITSGNKIIVESLDEYDVPRDKKLVIEAIERAILKYGEENVRYCNVVPVTKKISIEF